MFTFLDFKQLTKAIKDQEMEKTKKRELISPDSGGVFVDITGVQ